MEQESGFSVPEIVGIATAGATALGGVIVALSRAQSHDRRTVALTAAPSDTFTAALERGRDVALQATQVLAERLPAARDAASEQLGRVVERVPIEPDRVAEIAASGLAQARDAGTALLERAQDSVVPAVSDAAASVVHAASDVLNNARPAAASALDTASESAGRVAKQSGSLARETLSTLFWLATASALVYAALLSPERREQLKQLLASVVSEGRTLARDFQGYEEDF